MPEGFGEQIVGYSTNGTGRPVFSYPPTVTQLAKINSAESHPIEKSVLAQPFRYFGFGYLPYVDESGLEYSPVVIFTSISVGHMQTAASVEITYTGPNSPYYVIRCINPVVPDKDK